MSKWISCRIIYSVLSFQIVAADPDTLIASPCSLPKSGGELVLDDSLEDSLQLFWKLSWDRERPASSDFILRKRKMSARMRSGK
jgi:hypothetical protein